VGAGAVRLGVAGFGNVGREFVRLLLERRGLLEERYGLRVGVSFVADSRGALCAAGGGVLEWGLVERALEAPRGGVSRLPGGRPGLGVEGALEECGTDVLVDATPSRYEDVEPALGWWLRVLGSGGAVVAADKAPLAVACDRLAVYIYSKPRLYYKATVMAGTPLIDLLRWGYAGRRVERVVGALNGTTNYLLTRAVEGASFGEALREAQERGYAEPDPSADLEGFDLAAKASIVSCTLGGWIPLGRVERRARVDGEAFERARRATAAGRRLRYVAVVEPAAGRAYVDLLEAEPGSVLYDIRGVENAVVVESAEAGPVMLRGPGAGARATAAALLSDLVEAASVMGVL